MDEVFIIGVGMTPFGRYAERTLKDLSREAVEAALRDADLPKEALQAAFASNSMAGIVTGQEAIRGQVVLNDMGITSLPVVNVENACASGATALHQAWASLRAGLYDVVLVLGSEKLYHADRSVTYRALASATDVERAGSDSTKSSFLEESGRRLAAYMQRSGASIRHVAKVAEKSRRNGALNPYAQYREAFTADAILASPVVADPLTRLMCSPISDGAAALVLCSAGFMRRRHRPNRIRVAGSVLRSAGSGDPAEEGIVERASRAVYEMASAGPEDVSVAEVHDTTAASELLLYERLGLCAKDEAARFVDEGHPALGGRLPVNPSGGLISRGHPVGATGIAQVCELTWQLRGEAGPRQVPGARVALAHNAGGTIKGETAALAMHLLVADHRPDSA